MGHEVFVKGLVHVPEDRDLGHRVYSNRCVKILDRYVIREVVLPLLISLVVLTFVLMIPPILREAEALIAKGVEWSVIGRVLLTLLPSSLGITIPMSVLLGHPDRLRQAVGRPRVRRAAGLRRQPLPAAPAHRPHRPRRDRRRRLRDDRRAAGRESDLPRDHLQRRRRPGRKQRQAAGVLRRVSRTACSTCATSSRAAAGATSSWPTPRARIRRRCSSRRKGASSSTARSGR